VTPLARLRQADILMDSGHQQQAIDLIRAVWVESDFTAFEEKSLLQRYHGILRGEDQAQRLDRLIWDGQTTQAKRMLRHVGPDTAALGEARLALAEMEPGAERLIARVPAQLQRNPGLLFERMRWRRHKDHDDDAAEILEHAPADLGRPAAWATERLILVRRLLADDKAPLAYRLAVRHGLTEGATFAELEFFAGWVALRFLHQPDAAYNHFVRLYDEVKLPISIARGAYWAARAAEAMGYKQLGAAWYATAAQQITTYYGQLAAMQLGGTISATALAEPQPRPEDVTAFNQNELVRLARELAECSADDYVPPFLRRLVDQAKSPAEFTLAAHLAKEVARPDLAVTAAKYASYSGVTLLEEGYPLTELPPGGQIEPPLLLAMTRQESAFDRQATSSAGALGLMQLMPATASRIAKSLRLPFSPTRLTSDMRYNVTLGRAYLGSLIDNFSGSYVLAIAAYNAGPARVREWMQDYGDPRTGKVDVIDWIESIPYSETRNYVQRVLENLQVYRLRLSKETLSFSLASDLKR
jgi:soluble lytic murein transglycosylase